MWGFFQLNIVSIHNGPNQSWKAFIDLRATRRITIKPASLSALKCCESVDLGIFFSLTFKKLEQFCEHAEPTMSA
jgi:hypothetical protein